MNLPYNNSDFVDLPVDWEDFKCLYYQIIAIAEYPDYAMQP